MGTAADSGLNRSHSVHKQRKIEQVERERKPCQNPGKRKCLVCFPVQKPGEEVIGGGGGGMQRGEHTKEERQKGIKVTY